MKSIVLICFILLPLSYHPGNLIESKPLYINCGNEIRLSSFMPDIDFSGIEVQAMGAAVIKLSQKGGYIIVPTKEKVRLIVKKNGKVLRKKKFNAIDPPLPTIALFINAKKAENKLSFSAENLPKTLEIRASPDTGFGAELPKDARYRATSTKASLYRGEALIHSNEFTGPKLNLLDFNELIQSGDSITIEAVEVMRMNFKNLISVVNMPSTLFEITVK